MTIIGTLLGAYIHNIFTWKIKDKVDALDKVLALSLTFRKNTIGVPKSELVNHYTPDMATCNCMNIILDNKFTNELQQIEFEVMKNSINADDFNRSIDKLIKKIHSERTDITSWCYMLKQLILPVINRCSKKDLV